MINITETFRYFFGHEPKIEQFHFESAGTDLPALMLRQFELFTVRLPKLNKVILCLVPKSELPLRILENMYKQASAKFPEGPVMVYFEKLTTQDRRLLANRNVQFMVGDSFLYAPQLGIVGATRDLLINDKDLTKRHSLSPIAETILVGQLLDGKFTDLSGRAVANILNVTASTVSQSLQELEREGFVQLLRAGKGKIIRFEERAILWSKAHKMLRNPVELELSVENIPNSTVIKAGLSALAATSMLVEPEAETWAIHNRKFKQTTNRRAVNKGANIQGTIQLWRRDPQIYAQNNIVDPLSLYLSLRDSSDERVQKELKTLLDKLELEMPDER